MSLTKKSVASTKEASSNSAMSAGLLLLASVSSAMGKTHSSPCSTCVCVTGRVSANLEGE